MKKFAIRLVQTATLIFVVLLLSQLIILAVNLQTRHRAESLLMSFRELKVGTSTLADAQPILQTYTAKGGFGSSSDCPNSDVAYGIYVANDTINKLGEYHPFLLHLGLKPWWVSAVLSFKDGRLCYLLYTPSVMLLTSQYPLPMPDADVKPLMVIEPWTEVLPPYDDGRYEIESFGNFLRMFKEPGTLSGLRVTVTQNASPSELHDALTFDFSCITSLRGCRTRCQIMPLSMQDFSAQQRRQGLPVPDESKLPVCQKAYAANR